MFQSIPLKAKLLFAFAFVLVVFLLTFVISSFFSSKQTTSLHISSTPSGALVKIEDSTQEAITPAEIENLTLGSKITITLLLPGFNPLKKTITLTDRPIQNETLTLEEVRGAIPGDDDASEGLRIEQSQEYLEKIKQEPFWDVLPYWSPNKHFVIEYKNSDDYLITTTFGKSAQQNSQYQQEARAWLTENGANLSELTLRYQTGTYPQ